MGFNKLLNEFLAGILILIFHLFVGAFVDRSTVAYSMSLYIFVLTMIYLVGLPVDESTGEIKEEKMDFGPLR